MTFAADASAIFDGPLAVDASYEPEGEWSIALRVIPVLGDAESDFGAATFRSEAAVFWVLVADVASPAAGDVLTVGGDSYTVQGTPVRDERRLKWRIEARPE